MTLQNYRRRLQSGLAARQQYRAPQLTGTYLGLAGFVVVFLVVSVLAAGDHKIYYQFLEGHSVTALSSAFMAMTAGFAWACHLLRPHADRDWSRWFWVAFSLAFLFFSMDELLQFHEGFGKWLKTTSLGRSETFRNWNDAVVVAYGVVALVVSATFLPEILRYPRFAELLTAGFGFYVVHTAIDSIMRSSAKNIPEESAKLMATACFAAAGLTAMLTMHGARRDHGGPSGEVSRNPAASVPRRTRR